MRLICRWKGHRIDPDPGDLVLYCLRCRKCVDLRDACRPRRDPFDDRRSRYGPCEDCGAVQDEWCRPDCALIDPMDMR